MENSPLTFVETIRVDHGVVDNLSRHNRRLNDTLRHFWHVPVEIDLAAAIPSAEKLSAEGLDKEVVKVRVVYGEQGIMDVTASPYHRRALKTLMPVVDNTIDYTYKSTDRSALDRLFSLRGSCDDILIVRHGLVTDTSFTNVAFYDGKQWLTPATPLLRGTRRQLLLDTGAVKAADIPFSDLSRYQRVRLFNAMILFGEVEVVVK